MNTRKSSFRLLAIIICFAAVLGLATACAEPDLNPGYGPSWRTAFRPCYIQNGMTSAKIIDELNDEGQLMTTEDVIDQRPTREQMDAVIEKHLDLLLGYPLAHGLHAGDFMITPHRQNRTIGYGISVVVTEFTDPSTLSKNRRIPNCLDGVPVRIILGGLPIPYIAK